jgi:GH43 family beta-xylosidase
MMLIRVANLPKPSFHSGVLSLLIFSVSLALSSGETFAQESPEPTTIESTFVNPIGEGADPWVMRDPNVDRYLWCLSEGNRAIAIHTSDSVTSLGQKQIVWRAPEEGPYSREVWAPELHYLDDRWFIYFAASDGRNENHLAYVLQSKTLDPLGEYELHGPFATGAGADGLSPNIWAIDMTVLEHQGQRYAIWSGWDQPGSDLQYLYIAPMSSPTQLAGPRVQLCDHDDYLWERTEPGLEHRGLHEAPQVFQMGDRSFVVYSCGASWLPTYKLGLLELVGEDPLNPKSWKKREQPVFQSTDSTYGVGHSCWVPSLDGQQWWHVFHAKRDAHPGWRRAIFVQPLSIDSTGGPVLGTPVSPGTPLKRPSGDTPTQNAFSTDRFEYYGHHQMLSIEDSKFRLGQLPRDPVNTYRSGEKVVFTGQFAEDFVAEVLIDFQNVEDARDAGLLFRTTLPSVGYDAQRGYFAGFIPRTQLVILGKTDGTRWQELARASTSIQVTDPERLKIQVQGDQIVIWHHGKKAIEYQDSTYPRGNIGLRVVDTDATFSDLRVEPSAKR